MQAFSSSDATTKTIDSSSENNSMMAKVVDIIESGEGKKSSSSVGGRKSAEEVVAELQELSSDEESSEDVEEGVLMSSEEDSDYESEEEEEDDDDEEEEFKEFMKERRLILEDARQLKKVAAFFLHPEKPVEADGLASARGYFDRASAPQVESMEEIHERALILADAKALKASAAQYLHPERPVETTDATACARCYFDRASGPAYDDEEEGDAREEIMEDLQALKQMADFYLHPEKPIAVDATVFGRNYFTRASAEDQETFYEAEQRNLVLREMQAMKKLAQDYLHPELPVGPCADPTAYGRNYFMRASALEQEEDEYADERELILEEMKELKEAAMQFQHPELPVDMDATAYGRNYFTRASAPEQETFEEAEERARILADAAALKKLAVDYAHPELSVVTTDPTACGRNYFTRASAPEYEDEDATDERDLIFADLKALKQQAEFYQHPEKPISVDPTAFGRNYFGPEKETFYEAEQRALILKEMAQMRALAADYLHPERPLPSMGPTAFGRNYFTRPAAPEQEDEEYADEREIILEEMKELKQASAAYMHPERAVAVDSTGFGRNYFSRPSAPHQESFEEAEERACILEEMAELKKLAGFYMHPEKPVVTTDSTACARNYFSRPSAPVQESLEDAEERARILEEASELKKNAGFYMHPEKPVVTNDSTACARNYFGRASAPEQESFEDSEERSLILEEALLLKKLAGHYLHPEKPVSTTDSTACARNYFGRSSALGITHYIHSTGYANHDHHADNEYGHFDMEEDEMFDDMRQSIFLPGNTNTAAPKVQSNKVSSDEEGELSRSPSSVMLFTGALELEDDHPRLPTMG